LFLVDGPIGNYFSASGIMKKFAKVHAFLRIAQIVVGAALAWMMIRAMQMLFVLLKGEGAL
jgi:hypothetical protein